MDSSADAPDAGSLFQVVLDQGLLLRGNGSGFRLYGESLVAGVAFGALGTCSGGAVLDDGFGLLAVRASDAVREHDK